MTPSLPDDPRPSADPAPEAHEYDPLDPGRSLHLLETSPHEPNVRPWELELLISGAVVFSLLQLPGAVDDVFNHVRPQLDKESFIGAFMLYTYVKLILYVLITCFITHLVGRAYWVGLIGLESVFPRGVNWDNASYGPLMKEVLQKRIGRPQERIDAADRFCSVLFPLAFTMVLMFLYSVLILGAVTGFAAAVSRLLLGGHHFSTVLRWTIVPVAGLSAVFWLVDRGMGARVRPGTWVHRLMGRGAVATYYLNALPIVGPMSLTLFSNGNKNSRYSALYGALVLLFAFFFVKDVFFREGLLETGNTAYLPDSPGPMGVESRFYESQRDPDEVYDRAPSIQADVIRDPFVRLFIPYAPLRHGAAFAASCPAVRPLSRTGVRMQEDAPPDSAAAAAVLDCWARLQPVTLNGQAVRPQYRFYTHPVSGVRGVVAYLPTASLPRGENLLTVGVAPRDPTSPKKQAGVPDVYYIRFWR